MTSSDQEFSRNHFALFGLPVQFELNRDALEQAYQGVLARVHPDKHSHLSDAERRMAMQWATRANEAYLALKHPLARARYLLELAGHDAQVESNTAMPAQFLMVQMELREAVAEARDAGDESALDRMHRRLRQELNEQQALLADALDRQKDWRRAADVVRQLMFQEKLLHEIDDALAAIEA